MRYIYQVLVILIMMCTFSCKKTKEQVDINQILTDSDPSLDSVIEDFKPNYDSLLVDSVVNVTPDLRVAQLSGWAIDQKASQDKKDMLFFQNQTHAGILTVKAYYDGNVTSYLEEILSTFEGKNIISKASYKYDDKLFHQYMLRSEDYIVLKVIVEIDDIKYLDTNVIISENNFAKLSESIATYIASLAILN